MLGHEEMTIEEIMLGKGDYYPGLVPLVYAYLGHIGCDADTMDTIDQARVLTSRLDNGPCSRSSHTGYCFVFYLALKSRAS